MAAITYRTWYNTILKTTDATVTTIVTISINANTTVSIEIYTTARRTGGSAGSAEDAAYYRGRALYKNIAGIVSAIGSEITTAFESQAGWNIAWGVSGTNAIVQVTGAIDNNITWYIEHRFKEVKDG